LATSRTAQRNGKGRWTRSVEQHERDQEAARTYARFSSYSAGARHLDIPIQTFYSRVQRAIEGEPDNSVAAARTIALARLSSMATVARAIAEEEHLAHSNGRIITIRDDQGHDVPLPDRLPNLQAIDRLLRIEDQRNRLLGLYAPTMTRLEVIPADVIEAAIAQNERTIAALEKELGLQPGAPIDVAVLDATWKGAS
jgi:hypothetical protein